MSSNGTGGALQPANATRTDRYSITCMHWIIFTVDKLSNGEDNGGYGLYEYALPVLRYSDFLYSDLERSPAPGPSAGMITCQDRQKMHNIRLNFKDKTSTDDLNAMF